MGSAARALAVVTTAALISYPFVASVESGLYSAIGLASLGLVVLATAAYRPANAAGWWWLAGTMLLFVLGDRAYDLAARFPGPADAFYAPGYVAWFVALVVLMRHEQFGRDLGSWIDAGIVTVCVSTAVWCVFLDERTPTGVTFAHLLSWFYVVADLVLLAVVIRAALLAGRRSRSFWWLLVSVAVMPVADASYVLPALDSTWSYGYWADVLWLASYAAIAVAALDPSMRGMTDNSARPGDAYPTVRRVVVLGCSVLTIPLAALIADYARGVVDLGTIGVVSVVVTLAITLRFALIARQLHHAHAAALLSERRFRMVFERSPVGISVGRQGMMSETNPALHRMLGYTGDELARMHYSAITHPDDRALDVQAQLDSGERDSFSVDKRYVTKSGLARDAHVHIALDVQDGLGIALIEDISERRALEEQLRQAQKLEAVGRLAGGIAHEFNNLMTAVLGYSDLVLRRLGPDDPSRDNLEVIRSSATRAGELTRQLLAFSGRQMLRTRDVDLCEVVSGMEDVLRHTLGDAVELEIDLGAEPVVVRADEAQLEQVVFNLAVNAREAMPLGGRASIGVRRDRGAALLTFADTGRGMNEDTAAHIFEPFFTTKEVGEGTGLGLATVHGIVGQTGGTVAVASAPGEGAVFTVRLPLARGVLSASGSRASLVD